jgi:hypothetical protein
MGLPGENPPARLGMSDWFGVPDWLPRPIIFPPGLFPVIIPADPWNVYIPDEWGKALEKEGYAKSFWARGHWIRKEVFMAFDFNCNGWDVGDFLPKRPIITEELLPTSIDPATTPMSYEWVR